MNKNMRYMKNIRLFGLLLMLPLAFASCTDVWNGHYDEDNKKQTANKTLWEEIEARPELQGFADYLKQFGYDKVLDGDQMYTVFAPQGAINVDGLSTQKVKDEVLGNHIARFNHSANATTVDKKVKMLNEKLVDFTKDGDIYTFGNTPLVETNIIAKNGVLHVLNAQVPFFFNIWEYLTTSDEFSKIREFMYSFNEVELDEEASVKGPIVDGLQTYVDSVTVTYNELHYLFGQLNDEDSTYTMIIPTNEAWDAAYERLAPYYVYNKKKEFRDSLQDLYTKRGIINDLIFSHTVQRSVEDSLISTSENVFYNPFDYILSDYSSINDGVVCSNGNVFVVDSLRHAPWDSWHSKLKIEAEYINTHKSKENTTVEYSRNLEVTDPLYYKVSNRSYLELVPKSSSSATEVDFNIWNTLAATYDVKIVFLPQHLATDKSVAKQCQPNYIRVDMSYLNEGGSKTETVHLVAAKDSVMVDPTRIDTVNVGSITFPVSTYADEVASTKLNLRFAGKSGEKTKSRTFLIDCVILEPAKN